MEFQKRAIYGTSAAVVIGLALWGGASWRQAAVPPLAPVPSTAAGAVEVVAAGGDEPAPPLPTPAPPTHFQVHVAGAVNRPGTYTFKTGDRVADAIRTAGGLRPNANPDEPNHAEYLQDRDQVYIGIRDQNAARRNSSGAPASASSAAPIRRRGGITHGRRPAPSLPPDLPAFTKPLTAGAPVPIVTPAPAVRPVVVSAPPAAPAPLPRGRILGKDPALVAEAAAPPPDDSSGDSADSVPALEPGEGERASSVSHRPSRSARSSRRASAKFRNPGDGVVNINTAGAQELQKLPGVGPSMSARIIEHRQQKGPFRDISQLQDVRGIGVKTLAKMRPFITVQ